MSSSSSSFSIVHIVRHGEALHNVQRGYPHRDPPLTEAGVHATKEIKLPTHPDLIVVSPMTRSIQTAINMFPDLQQVCGSHVPVQIWPDLREANDAICNLGLARNEMQSKFPHLDFLECHENWDYPLHTIVDATARAERVRKRLQHLSATFKNIVVISHRGLIAYLVKGRRFSPAELRSYRFATNIEAQDEKVRWGVHCDLLQDQDFGPTVFSIMQTCYQPARTQKLQQRLWKFHDLSNYSLQRAEYTGELARVRSTVGLVVMCRSQPSPVRAEIGNTCEKISHSSLCLSYHAD